jgi:hypothetical protein
VRNPGLGAAATLLLTLGIALTACTGPSQVDSTEPTPEIGAEASDQAWGLVASKHPGAERPDVEVIRVAQMDERPQLLATCMNEAGFPDVTVSADGGVMSGEVSAEQSEAYDVAFYVCQTQYPLDPKYNEPLTDDQLSLLYEYYTGELSECLHGLGYTFSDPPSKQSFIDSYTTAPWGPWYESVQQVTSDAEYDTLVRTCPQLPTNLYE